MDKPTIQEELICNCCKIPLIPKKTFFNYLGHSFFTDIPTCPSCGLVFISETLAKGRMAQVEQELEDK